MAAETILGRGRYAILKMRGKIENHVKLSWKVTYNLKVSIVNAVHGFS